MKTDDKAVIDGMGAFQQTVWEYYYQHGRHDLPWRQAEADGRFDPYRILVSEVMLQQTQVARVLPKYLEFLRLFPRVQDLASAALGDVLVAWQGLGYNRRAKFLWQAARQVTEEYGGVFPRTAAGLAGLPGIGLNTAGAIVAYAYDQPAVFIETNIRTVFIHHFFGDRSDIHDKEIQALVAAALPVPDGQGGEAGQEPGTYRQWYWALMDYGVYLKQTVGNKSRASRSYSRQSPFHGSRRQVRGAVIRQLGARPLTGDELRSIIADPRLDEVLQSLAAEEMIREEAGRYRLS